jgi:hypothetical protein
MRLQALLLGLLCCLSAMGGYAQAAAPAVVDSVQAPAWIDRGDRSWPLTPGFELQSGDVVRTGAGARAYLKLAEGSTVKLGEAARFTLYSRSLHPERMLKGALDIAAGAFRFTTDALRRARGQRELSIRVVTATIGIRGTDVWGRADAERDLVVLIEGHIELSRAGQMLELVPMSYMDAPRGQPAEIDRLDPAVLHFLARETEIEPGDGASTRHGDWAVALGDFASEQEVLERYDQFRDYGFAVRVMPRPTEGGWRYVLRLPGFASATEARAAAARIKVVTGVVATVIRSRKAAPTPGP